MRTFVSLEDARLQRDQHARANVITQRDGSYEMHARNAELLARGKGCRHHVAAGMPARRP